MANILSSFIALLVLTLSSANLLADERFKPLVDEFEKSDFDSKGGLFYKKNREQSAGKVEFQTKDVRYGKGALSLSIKPLCRATNDDCSERAEVWEKKKLQLPYDQPVWYAISMKLADPVPSDNHRYVMAQWKRKILSGANTPFSPFFALRLNKGKLVFTVETDKVKVFPVGKGERAKGCLKGETLVFDRPHEKQTRALVSKQADMKWLDWRHYNGCTKSISAVQHSPGLPKATNGWVDFMFFIQTGPRGKGRVEIFANNRHITTVTGHIGHMGSGLGDNQYFKFGPYRAGKSDNWTILYDRFRRGLHCTDVTSNMVCRRFAQK